MKVFVLIILFFSIHSMISAQSETSSRVDLNEAVKSNLTHNILPFWSEKMFDNQNGGFYGRMGENLKLYKDADRGGILNARILWSFSAAFRVLNDSAYLKTATHAKKYIFDHFIDKEFGGSFRSVNSNGKPNDMRKQTYTQAFFVYALSEYYLATGDKQCLDEAIKIYNCIEDNCLDKINNGYFEVYSRDWKRLDDRLIGEKDRNDQKGMNTHLHLLEAYTNLYLAWPDQSLEKRLRNMIELFATKIIDPKTYHLIIFTNEKWEKTSPSVSYGHDIEASWLLHEAATVLGDKEWISKTTDLSLKIVSASEEGLQTDGSLIYEKDILTGHTNTQREWWVEAEAIVGFMNAFELTNDQTFLQKADKCWQYIYKNQIDHVNGEWFYQVSEDGKMDPKKDKAGFWKCPYHNSRMCLEVIERTKH